MSKRLTIRVPQAARTELNELMRARLLDIAVHVEALRISSETVALHLMHARAAGCPAALGLVPTPEVETAAFLIGVRTSELLRAAAMEIAKQWAEAVAARLPPTS
ncbi:MAG: hypothetical protein ACR2M0_15610 [Chloroflexia bacterium]